MLYDRKLQHKRLRGSLRLRNALALHLRAVDGGIPHIFHLVAEIERVCGGGFQNIRNSLHHSEIFDGIGATSAVAHHFDGRRFAVLAGRHHVGAGGGQGYAELVGADFRIHAVRPYNFTIPIHDFQRYRARVHHRQVHVGGARKRVWVVLRQGKTTVGNRFINTRAVLHDQRGVGPIDGLAPALCQVGDGYTVELHIMVCRIPSRERKGDGLCESHNAHQGNGNKA